MPMPVVRHAHHDLRPRRAPPRGRGGRPRSVYFDGVVEEVPHDLREPDGVAVDPQGLRDDLRPRASGPAPAPAARAAATASSRTPRRSSGARRSSTLPRRMRETSHEVVDQPGEVPHLPVGRGERAPPGVGGRPVVPQDLEGAHHGREGVAQLVREHGEELVLAAVGLGEIRGAPPELLLLRAPRRLGEELAPLRRGGALALALELERLALRVHEPGHLVPQDLLGHDRLREEVHGPEAVAAQHLLVVGAVAGEEDDRRAAGAPPLADERRGLEAAHPRHLDVEDDDREVLVQEVPERLLAGARERDPRRQAAQERPDGVKAPLVVVHDEDPRLFVARDGALHGSPPGETFAASCPRTHSLHAGPPRPRPALLPARLPYEAAGGPGAAGASRSARPASSTAGARGSAESAKPPTSARGSTRPPAPSPDSSARSATTARGIGAPLAQLAHREGAVALREPRAVLADDERHVGEARRRRARAPVEQELARRWRRAGRRRARRPSSPSPRRPPPPRAGRRGSRRRAPPRSRRSSPRRRPHCARGRRPRTPRRPGRPGSATPGAARRRGARSRRREAGAGPRVARAVVARAVGRLGRRRDLRARAEARVDAPLARAGDRAPRRTAAAARTGGRGPRGRPRPGPRPSRGRASAAPRGCGPPGPGARAGRRGPPPAAQYAPPAARAASQESSAVRAFPRWRGPVGDGAKRPRIIGAGAPEGAMPGGRPS